jgi:hypothetical protein
VFSQGTLATSGKLQRNIVTGGMKAKAGKNVRTLHSRYKWNRSKSENDLANVSDGCCRLRRYIVDPVSRAIQMGQELN